MTKQKTPHTQTQQDVTPEQTDIESNELDASRNKSLYRNMNGAETGEDRAPRKTEARSKRKRVVPESPAHEGDLTTRAPKRPVQGVTSRSAKEESDRQEKVVNDRPDAQAGVNHTK